MELILSTKSYAAKLSKSADIESNDPIQPIVKVNFAANVLTKPDSVSQCRYSPELVEFIKGDKAKTVILSNHGDSVLNITVVSAPTRSLDIKNKPFSIKPGQIKQLDFKWKGPYADNDSNIAVTFAVDGGAPKRFTIPVVIKGTKPPPPKPTPIEKPKSVAAQPRPSQSTLQQPTPAQTGNKWPGSDSLQPGANSKK